MPQPAPCVGVLIEKLTSKYFQGRKQQD